MVEFTFLPGTSGTEADLTLANSAGIVTKPKAVTYLPAMQQFPLPGAALAQGIYDAKRDLYYFTDQTQIQIFSRAQGNWRPPVSVANAVRLWGLALSPDGSKLAVSDAGTNLIYTMNPDSLSTQMRFPLPNTLLDQGGRPSGLVITNTGIVYYVSFYLSGTGQPSLHKLDTQTGQVTDFSLQNASPGSDMNARMLLSNDNSRVFFNLGGLPSVLETSTDAITNNLALFNQGDYELALSGNEARMTAADYLMDSNLNGEAFLGLNEREIWNETPVYGEKLSADGVVLYRPLSDALDVLDGRTGVLLTRIALPTALCANYDALVADGKDNILIAITGKNGDGIAVLDLTSLPEPGPLPYTVAESMRPGFTANEEVGLPAKVSQDFSQHWGNIQQPMGKRNKIPDVPNIAVDAL
jgi:hypothetical protein